MTHFPPVLVWPRNLCVLQATQGYPVNKRVISFIQRREESANKGELPGTSHTKTEPDFSAGERPTSFALALAWIYWKFILLHLFSKWLLSHLGSSGILTSSQKPCNMGHLNEMPKGWHHLVAKRLATCSLSHFMVAPRLGFRELVFI